MISVQRRLLVDEVTRAQFHASRWFHPVFSGRDREARLDLGLDIPQHPEYRHKTSLEQARVQAILADPPLELAVAHPRGLVQYIVRESLDDDSFANLLAQEPCCSFMTASE